MSTQERAGKPVGDNESHYRMVENDVIYGSPPSGGPDGCVAAVELVVAGLDGDPSYVTMIVDTWASLEQFDEAVIAARARFIEAQAHDARLRDGSVS